MAIEMKKTLACNPFFVFFYCIILFVFGACEAGAILSRQDKQLNENLDHFIPIYTDSKRVSWNFWSSKYEFVLSLLNSEKLNPRPPSDIKNIFLGYSNFQTKVKVVCNTLHPIYENVIAEEVVGVFDIKDSNTLIPYKIEGLPQNNEVNLLFSIKRDMLDVKVLDSGKWFGMFKTYAKTRIFNVNLKVFSRSVDASRSV